MAESPSSPIKSSIAAALRETVSPPSPPAASPAAPSAAPAGSAPSSAPPQSELCTIKLDGREVQAQKGANLLEVCLAHGVDVSYFCYHPGLSSPAVCRQCLVEVVGQPKLVPACFTPIADKMEINTATPRVLTIRRQMLEFTLVNHPVDCPICDKAGECTLQKQYQDWDHVGSRSSIPKVHKPKMQDLGPHIVLDSERCILCTRCIRVCDEVAGQKQLTMAWRGDREQLTVAPGHQLDNPYSLNTVDVCPVGALTSKDFRFTMRAWELFTTSSVCPGCATGCNVEVHHAQGEIWRLVPRENLQVNKYWMCDEGRFTYKDVRHKRLTSARIGGGRGQPAQITSVDKAVAFAAERLERLVSSGGTIGLVYSAQTTNEALFALSQVAAKLTARGATIRAYVSGAAPRPERADKILRSADVNPNTAGAKLLAGVGAGDAQALLADLKAGKLKGLWMVGTDLPLGEQAEFEIAPLADGLELLICQAVHDSPLLRRAHVQLPAAAWAEVDGTFTNAKHMVQRLRKAVAPQGDARAHLELVTQIAKKANLAQNEKWQVSARQAFLQMVAEVASTLPPGADPAQSVAAGFAVADWGKEFLPVQLRFASSRG
jgi:NADH-quinone oxidoreductase subunit G